MPHLSLAFLGTFQAKLDSQPIPYFRSTNVQGLLAYLALQPERSFTREALAVLFWPDLPDSSAKKNLRQSLYQLRQLLNESDSTEEPFLLIQRQTVQFNAAASHTLDVFRFLQAIDRGDLNAAAALYSGELLAGFTCDSLEFENWLRQERERLHRLALEALTELTRQQLAQQDFAAAQATARRQLALEPWHEEAHRQLMTILALTGQRGAALAQYESCVAILDEEMGLDPSAATVALQAAIGAGELEMTPAGQHAKKGVLPAPDRQAELILLDKVRAFWVEGVLQQTLGIGSMIELAMETVPDGVANPWQSVVGELELPRQPISPGKTISDIFTACGRELLILGEPGSGKTVMLLELARTLLARAKTDPNEPLPVVLNLASWASKARPLDLWLVDELNEKYLIPKKMGQTWLTNDRLLLLLDGLDEVEFSQQADCAGAINQFRQQYGLVPLALACRYQHYQAIGTPLRLNEAILLRPLTAAQTNAYLSQLDQQAHGLRQAIQADPTLQEIAQSPLMLQVMSKAYRQGSGDVALPSVSTSAPTEQRKERLLYTIFDTYFHQMLKQLVGTSQHSAPQSQYWLVWLAQQLSGHNQTVFMLEALQPTWLTSRRQRWLYMIMTRVLLGLFVGLTLWLFGLTGRQIGVPDHSRSSLLIVAQVDVPLVWIDLVMSLLINGVYGVIAAALDILFFERRQKQPTAISRWDWPRKIALASVVALIAFIQLTLLQEQPAFLALQVISEAFMFVLFAHFAFGQGYGNDGETVEALRWSGRGSMRGVLPALAVGLMFSVVVWQLFPAQRTLLQIVALIGIPITFLVLMLLGLTDNHLETKTQPDQGIRLSAQNALLAGSLASGITGLFAWIGGAILRGQGLPVTNLFWMYCSVVAFLIASLAFGGFNVINHLVLRLLLWQSGQIPRRYVPFLNAAARHVLLYRVGGGYIFIHRLLQEHLTQKSLEPPHPPDQPAQAQGQPITDLIPSNV
jgi:DNA-binding SARP family transcriptional activator